MEKLNFIVNWGKNKETAWSGTNYSIFKALSKYYAINEDFKKRFVNKSSRVYDKPKYND